MRVVGTAGHVDHGKSTLVRCLTGIDPDRLAEEKARQMTIDLGFAWLTLPGGEQIGIVDVPGHRDFIENMLAGVGGIDAVLLVIAADEGVMPQTREHLAILDLLNVQTGLIALTKTDLIDDPDWLDLVESDVREALHGTTLADAPIVRVSAANDDGIGTLIAELETLLSALPPHVNLNTPRLSIDRIFTMTGFGTVVTGTLLGGSLTVGDEIEIQPMGLRGRIRGLQSYQQQLEIAYPGSRAAVNISGIEKSALERGFVLSKPGMTEPTPLIDVRFRHLADASRPLKHNAAVKLFVGAAEIAAHVRLLDAEQLAPGAEGWLQLRLARPLAATHGDRFILRYPSPGETIGGGVIVEAHPGRRWRRFQPDILDALETRLKGTPAEQVTQAAAGTDPVKRSALQGRLSLSQDDFERALHDAVSSGMLIAFPDDTYLEAASWHALIQRTHAALSAYHNAEPLRAGMPREELRSRLGLKNATFAILLERTDSVIAQNGIVRLTTHSIHFSDSQKARIQALWQAFSAEPFTPPSFGEAAQIVGEDILRALIELGDIVQVQSDVIFSRDVYEQMVAAALSMIDEQGALAAAAFRDHFPTSRKYAIGLLEYLDSIGITRRVGDQRVRGARLPQ